MNNDLKINLEKLKESLPKDTPIGLAFETKNKKYYYDTVIGKIFICNNVDYYIINKILSNNIDDIAECKKFSEDELMQSVVNIISMIDKELIFRLDKFESMISYDDIEDKINNQCQQLILEVTEGCNLRCGYCIYNDMYLNNRNHGKDNMTKDIAFKAIDYINSHSDKVKTLYITFYGGEPLLMYDLIKKCIHYIYSDYSCNKVKNYKFSFTTNATLIDYQMAKELSQIKNLSITVSLDGPEIYHDAYRRNIGGKGSFNETIKGLKYLVEAFGYERAKKDILISMVYTPPYSQRKIEDIQNFFENLKWLPSEIVKFVTYPDVDSLTTINEYLKKYNKKEEINPNNDEIDYSLLNWSLNNSSKNNIFSSKLVLGSYLPIYKRNIFKKVINVIGQNGCCIPGQRRIYTTVHGNFKVCERIGNAPIIGNVENGIDIEIVKEVYFKQYREKSESCKTCWYARLCSICYANTYDETGLNSNKRSFICNQRKDTFKKMLTSYFEILENNPVAFDYLKDIVIA